jgi:hypothetical protein
MSEQREQPEPTEDELRAALEEQLRHITAFDVIAQTAISLINLAGRRLGLSDDTKDERDLSQVRDAIDATRALLPVLERDARGSALGPLRDALSSLQMEYAKQIGETAPQPPGTPSPGAGAPTSPLGPAQQSGRLWVPGSAERPRR